MNDALIGRQLMASEKTVLADNPYASWIELYSGDEFQQGVAKGALHIDELLADIDINSERGRRLIDVFKTATRMEIAFWQQGLDAKISEQAQDKTAEVNL